MKHSGTSASQWNAHTQAQIAAQLTPPTAARQALQRARGGAGVAAAPLAAKNAANAGAGGKARLRQDRSVPNKWEQEFEAKLRAENPGAVVLPQAFRLRLGNGAWYKTDVVMVKKGADSLMALAQCGWWTNISAYEIKGQKRQAGILAIKVAASLYPWITFHLVTKLPKKRGGGWQIELVLP